MFLKGGCPLAEKDEKNEEDFKRHVHNILRDKKRILWRW